MGRRRFEAAASLVASSARRSCGWSDLVQLGSYAEVARRGQRLEGKTYEVQDVDVLTVRFNV